MLSDSDVGYKEVVFPVHNVEWLIIGIKTNYVNGIKTSAQRIISLGTSHSQIDLVLNDAFSFKINENLFSEIREIVMEKIGFLILKKMLARINSEWMEIKDSCWKRSGIVLNRKLFPGSPFGSKGQEFPYSDVAIETYNGVAKIFYKQDPEYCLTMSFLKDRNACLIAYLLAYLQELNPPNVDASLAAVARIKESQQPNLKEIKLERILIGGIAVVAVLSIYACFFT